MNALRDRSRSIQFEAFHIFKIFAANPNKHPEVKDHFCFSLFLACCFFLGFELHAAVGRVRLIAGT
jgi:calcium binding protein 39